MLLAKGLDANFPVLRCVVGLEQGVRLMFEQRALLPHPGLHEEGSSSPYMSSLGGLASTTRLG